MGPFLRDGVYKSLRLYVGAGRIRTGADVLGAKGLAGLRKAVSEVSGSVVRLHLAAQHATAIEPSHSSAQEADRCGQVLVRQNLHVNQSGGIIDWVVE